MMEGQELYDHVLSLYKSGLTYREIEQDLKKLGVKTSTKKPYGFKNIDYLLNRSKFSVKKTDHPFSANDKFLEAYKKIKLLVNSGAFDDDAKTGINCILMILEGLE
jgi:hypothetical protein